MNTIRKIANNLRNFYWFRIKYRTVKTHGFTRVMHHLGLHPWVKLELGNNVQIGPYCYIASDTVIGNNVLIGSGAKVLGPFKVGDNSRIAANAVVLTEVPNNATAVGIPARIVRIAGERTDFAGRVDQINITDPVQKELQAMQSRLEFLEHQMEKEKNHEAV